MLLSIYVIHHGCSVSAGRASWRRNGKFCYSRKSKQYMLEDASSAGRLSSSPHREKNYRPTKKAQSNTADLYNHQKYARPASLPIFRTLLQHDFDYKATYRWYISVVIVDDDEDDGIFIVYFIIYYETMRITFNISPQQYVNDNAWSTHACARLLDIVIDILLIFQGHAFIAEGRCRLRVRAAHSRTHAKKARWILVYR